MIQVNVFKYVMLSEMQQVNLNFANWTFALLFETAMKWTYVIHVCHTSPPEPLDQIFDSDKRAFQQNFCVCFFLLIHGFDYHFQMASVVDFEARFRGMIPRLTRNLLEVYLPFRNVLVR